MLKVEERIAYSEPYLEGLNKQEQFYNTKYLDVCPSVCPSEA